MMHVIILAAVALYALAGAVMAADLPSRKGPPPAAYAPPPPAGWNGVYAGLQIGYAWQQANLYNYAFPAFTVAQSFSPNGVIGGAFAGVNRQFGHIVVGVEGDIEGSGVSARGPLGGWLSQDVRGSARGRIGYAFDRAHVFATGGLAVADVSYSNPVFSGLPAAGQYSTARAGWTVGGGVEFALTPNWFVRAEYRYSDLGRVNYHPAAALGQGAAASVTDNSVRAGVGYKFDFAAPAPGGL